MKVVTRENMAIGLCQTLGRKTLTEIHVSGVTHQVRQLKQLIDEQGNVRRLHQFAIQNLTR